MSKNETQATQDAAQAHMYAVASVMAQDNPGAAIWATMTADEIITDFVTDFLDQVGDGPDRERLMAAARQAAIEAAESVAYPALWRQGIRAVELCQRAAELSAVPV